MTTIARKLHNNRESTKEIPDSNKQINNFVFQNVCDMFDSDSMVNWNQIVMSKVQSNDWHCPTDLQFKVSLTSFMVPIQICAIVYLHSWLKSPACGLTPLTRSLSQACQETVSNFWYEKKPLSSLKGDTSFSCLTKGAVPTYELSLSACFVFSFRVSSLSIKVSVSFFC